MKKYLVVLASMVMVLTMVGGVWAATTSQDVSVSAAVQTMCKNGTDGTMSFGTIDPSSTSAVTATSSGLTYKCSNGTTFNVTELESTKGGQTGTCASFTGTMESDSTSGDTLNYNATCTAGPYTGQGFGTGKGVSVNINGEVTVSQFENAVPHSDYTDTLVVTISY
jgi:spore coat protein U-like protein